jgi:RNA polymerase sigma-70 factor (ECF subfamily)
MTTAEQGPGDLPMCLSADLEGSFEQLMQAYQDRLYSFALRLSGNPQDAEEIVQDAFVRAYRALQGYPAGRIQALALRPWLYQISLNVFRNRVRGKRLRVVPIEDEGDDGADRGPAAPERDRPEAAAAQAELRDELAAQVAALPARYRAAVVLRFIEGLSYAEVAQALAQPAGTVKANVHRGILELRRRMLARRGDDLRISANASEGEVVYGHA